MAEIDGQDNRPSVYFEGNLLIIRASAIGHPCLYELIAAGQKQETLGLPGTLYRAFREGHEAEPLIIEELERDHKFSFQTKQVEGELILPDNVVVRYHPDGIGQVPHGFIFVRAVIEIKNLSHALWIKAVNANTVGAVFDEYNWQLSIMMHAEQLPGQWVARNKGYPPDRDTGIKPYCPDEGKLFIQPLVLEPPIPLHKIQEKAALVREGVLGEDITTTDRQCDAPNHFPCRFLHLRPEPEPDGENMEDNPGVLHLEDELGEQADRLVREYLLFKGQADESEKRAKEARDRLIALAGDETTQIVTDKWIIPILQASRQRIEYEKMSPELRAMVEKYKVKSAGARYVRDIKRRD